MATLTPAIPSFLLRQSPEPKFLLTDDTSLIITTGEQIITLTKSDIARMRAFFNRFDLDQEALS